jgi:hypothetical protein
MSALAGANCPNRESGILGQIFCILRTARRGACPIAVYFHTANSGHPVHPWHAKIVRSARQGPVYEWARLEGKSATMREDLYRQRPAQTAAGERAAVSSALLLDLLVVAAEAWWHLRSR